MGYIGENPNFKTTILDDKGVSAVANAPTGKIRTFNRAGQLILKDDAGNETPVGTSAGGTNYVLNPDAEVNATQDVAATNVTLAAETGSPVQGVRSFELTNLVTQAGSVDWDITISDDYVNGSIALLFSAIVRVNNIGADGDWTIGIWRTSGTPAYVTEQTDLQVNIDNHHRATFTPEAGATYKVRVEFTDGAAGAADRIALVDKLNVTPDSNSGLADTASDWVTYIPLVFQSDGSTAITVADNQSRWRRQGPDLEVELLFRASSSVGTGTVVYVHAPVISGVTTEIFTGSATQDKQIGDYSTAEGPDASAGDFQISQQRNASVQAYMLPQISVWGGQTSVRFSGKFRVAPPEWVDNKVNLLTQDTVAANVRVRYSATDTVYTLNTTIDFDTAGNKLSTVGTWANTNGSTTIPANGSYHVKASVGSGSGWTDATELWLQIGGTNYALLDRADAETFLLGGSTLVDLSLGNILTIEATTSNTLNVDVTVTYLEIVRINEYGAFDPVGFALATALQSGLVYAPVSNAVERTAGAVTTGSPVFSDLTDATITLTLQVPGRIAYAFTGTMRHTTGSTTIFLNVLVGATVLLGTDGLAWTTTGVSFDQIASMSGLTAVLPAGTHTIKVQWRANIATATMFADPARPLRFSAWSI
jgi:hypothetical protein